jgi:hypothetical protein
MGVSEQSIKVRVHGSKDGTLVHDRFRCDTMSEPLRILVAWE